MHTRSASQSAVQILVALVCAAPLSAQQPATSSPTQTAAPAAGFHEELIADLPSGADLKELASAGNHVAWQEKDGKEWIVKLDGKQQGGTYEGAEYLLFTSDGSHLHFFGKRDGKWIHVLDGKESSPGFTVPTTIALQPNGNSFAFGGCTEKKRCHLYVDDKEAPGEYEQISFPRYSSDGKRLAYFGLRSRKWIAVLDGKETGPELEDFVASQWGFSRHSNRFYAAALPPHSKWTYLVDDTLGPVFDVLSPIAFSSDDKHYAYAGVGSRAGFKKQKTFGTIVLDGQAGTAYEGSGFSGMWTVLVGSTETIAVGERNLQANFHGVSNPVFSPDGTLVYAARRDKGNVVVLSGEQAGPAFDEVVSAILFSNEPKHLAYIGKSGDTFVEVRDNQPGKTFPIDTKIGWVDWITMSKDGSRLAYELVRGGNQFIAGGTLRARRSVVLDGQRGKEYNADGISLLLFSPDHRHYIYPVIRIEGKSDLVVVDDAESKSYDQVNSLRFAEDGSTVTFLARDSSRLLRVTASLQ